METYFEHYVLGGGWAMVLLIPASLATIAAALRAWLGLRPDAVAAADAGSSAGRVQQRLAEIFERHGTVSAEDVRAEVDGEALSLFSMLQPLSAMATVAPLAGVLGSLTAIMSAHAAAARQSAGDAAGWVSGSIERALIPSAWGVGIALVASAAYMILRARVWWVETRVLRPAAERAAGELLGSGGRSVAVSATREESLGSGRSGRRSPARMRFGAESLARERSGRGEGDLRAGTEERAGSDRVESEVVGGGGA